MTTKKMRALGEKERDREEVQLQTVKRERIFRETKVPAKEIGARDLSLLPVVHAIDVLLKGRAVPDRSPAICLHPLPWAPRVA